MKYTTKIRAIDPKTGGIKTYAGPIIEAISFKDADNYCQRNGLGYCSVDGILVAEIPADKNNKPIWGKMIDYDFNQN